MALTKTERKQFSDLKKEIERLQKELDSAQNSSNSNYRNWQDSVREINSIHAALDTLPGIPQKRVKIDDYTTVELTINARLFSWVANAAFGAKSKTISEVQ